MKNKSIYILEDSKIIGGLMKNSIENYLHYKAENVLSVDDLFALFDTAIPDFIVLDYFLGQHEKEFKTGLEVAFHIKENYGNIPFIFISGVRNLNIIDEIKSCQPIAFVHKDENAFFDIINEHIKKTLA